jgi:hypothetical protein
MAAVQKLDPAVVSMEKTERWRKLRVHGVALDCYMGEGGLDVAREEIEVMTGEKLPYAPRWIKWITRKQGEEGEGRGRTWMRMTEIAEARLRRTATSYCNIDSLAKGRWPPIGEEGVFTRVEAHAEHYGFPP